MSKELYVIEAKTDYDGSKWEWVPYVHIDGKDYNTVFEFMVDAEETVAEINKALCRHNITHVRYRIRQYKRARKKKERKRVTCQPCSCPKCGEMLIMPRKVVKADPQYDTERVRELIQELVIAAHQLGRPVKELGKKEISGVLHRADLYHDALLAELGLEVNDDSSRRTTKK